MLTVRTAEPEALEAAFVYGRGVDTLAEVQCRKECDADAADCDEDKLDDTEQSARAWGTEAPEKDAHAIEKCAKETADERDENHEGDLAQLLGLVERRDVVELDGRSTMRRELRDGERGEDCRDEAPPRDLLWPEGTSLLHAEKHASNGRSESRLHAVNTTPGHYICQFTL